MNPSDRFDPFGYQLDRDTGVYYVQARSYDPTVGRWLVEEPVGKQQEARSPAPGVDRQGV